MPELPEDASPLERLRVANMGPQTVPLAEGRGTANVYATFSEPGQYMLRIQVDNWAGPDSSEADQCCWTNVYQTVRVLP